MQADYVVVGSGSAGAALAFRLAEAGHSVLVIEYGGSDAGPLIRMPAALSYPMNMSRYDWGFATEPEPHLDGRRLACPRGKVLGGSSSINGMVYVRGHPADYDHWAGTGAHGWAWRDVEPVFRRLECWHGPEPSTHRGDDGPLHVTLAAGDGPLHRAFRAAGCEAGLPATPDYNGAEQEGVAATDCTIWRGRRWSAADAYLRPALRTGRAELVRGLALRVVFDGARAVGVEVRRGGRTETVGARAEVILSASAINTPKLLMLSGLGPAEHLAANGIAVRADHPGAGGNLQDHLEVYVQRACTAPVSLHSSNNWPAKLAIGAQWLATGRGIGASNHIESVAFLRSAPGVAYPDLQLHFVPVAMRYDGTVPFSGHGFQAHVGPMRSPSRGTVRLAGPDPAEAPEIRFNYMSAPEDWRDFRRGIRLVRRIFAQPSFAPYAGAEISPGPDAESDADLDAFVREHSESAYHPCGTARLGASDDPMAVIDPDCRVIGVDGLRVADSSIFPRITNGNLNAPSIMVGEKAADHILGRL